MGCLPMGGGSELNRRLANATNFAAVGRHQGLCGVSANLSLADTLATPRQYPGLRVDSKDATANLAPSRFVECNQQRTAAIPRIFQAIGRSRHLHSVIVEPCPGENAARRSNKNGRLVLQQIWNALS